MTCECNGTGVVMVPFSSVRWGHACGGDERRCAIDCPVPEEEIDYEPQPCECGLEATL